MGKNGHMSLEDLLIADEYLKGLRKERAKREDILSNTNYFKWLVYFTEDKDGFCDREFYYSDKLGSSDKENVENLGIFFDAIKMYAQDNYIYPTHFNSCSSYKIRLDKVGFEIGIKKGQESLYFCNKVPVDENNITDFIDFNYIMGNREQENAEFIEKSLDDIRSTILDFYGKGVPAHAVIDELNDIISEIERKEEKAKKRTRSIDY